MQDSVVGPHIKEIIQPVVVSPIKTDEELIGLAPLSAAEEKTEVPHHQAHQEGSSYANPYAVSTYTLPADTALTAEEKGPVEGEVKSGIILVNPASEYIQDTTASDSESLFGEEMSWIYLVLGVLFCLTGLKFKGSTRYLKALVSDMTDTRVRHNAFDDTVKETSLMILLNIVWVACAGIMLWVGVSYYVTHGHSAEGLLLRDSSPEGIAICAGIAAIYLIVMLLAYWIVGNVFSDSRQTRLWVKGAAASTGLQSFLLFPLALVALNYPAWGLTLIIIGASVFIVGKIVFLFQGFRIFFTQITSWLLFLYYLCSLEIIPVILTCAATVGVCTTRL